MSRVQVSALMTIPLHFPNTSLRSKCAIRVRQNFLRLPHELELIIKAWPDLSDEARGEIIAIISKKEEEK